MKTHFLTGIRWLLMFWGGVSFVAVVFLFGLFAVSVGTSDYDSVDRATVQDVRFVLNWCSLGDERIEKVVHSFTSSRGFTGDHLDAYAIKISHVSVEELGTRKDNWERFYRGDQLPPILNEAVEFTGAWLKHDRLSWFPTVEEIRSEQIYVYPWRIRFHGISVEGTELIFVRPSDNMVFYFSCET